MFAVYAIDSARSSLCKRYLDNLTNEEYENDFAHLPLTRTYNNQTEASMTALGPLINPTTYFEYGSESHPAKLLRLSPIILLYLVSRPLYHALQSSDHGKDINLLCGSSGNFSTP